MPGGCAQEGARAAGPDPAAARTEAEYFHHRAPQVSEDEPAARDDVAAIAAASAASGRASLRIRKRQAANRHQASELSRLRSQSLDSRRQRDIQANVRSTTQRRQRTVNPLISLGFSTTSRRSPKPSSPNFERSFGPR